MRSDDSGNKMEHEKDGGSGSLPITKRPKFFKVLMQDASLNLRIPRMFHVHLPSRLPKMATLLCPHSMSWDVQIHQSGPDIFFQKGWPEFIKAHNLHTGHFLAFQYNGTMNFEVEVFDTTCCLKDYPHKHCTRVVPPVVKIEESSDSEDTTLNYESDGKRHGSTKSNSKEKNSSICEVQRVAKKQNNFQIEQMEETSCRRPIYIKIEESSESEDTKNCKKSREIPNEIVQKRRKLSNSNDEEKKLFQKDPRVIQMEAQGKKIKSTHNSNSCSQFEKILTPSMTQSHMINIPKSFCVKNGLITNRTIFLKRKVEGEGKVLPNEWRVGFFFGPKESRIRQGWNKFCKETKLKIGERCIFQLISKDTLLVQTVSKNHIEEEVQTTRGVTSKNKVPHPEFQSATSQSAKIVFSTRPKMQSKKNWRSGMRNAIYEKGGELSIPVRQYHLTYKYMPIPFGFCQTNDLMSRREMILRGSDGKEWHLIFFLNGSKEGRFCGAGWRKFATENGLRAGDKCLLKIVAEELVLVHVVKSENEE